MAVETAKDKIRLSELIGQKQEILNIDGDIIVNDIKPDALKIINTNGTLFIYKKEVLNGKIKLEGCINAYIIYLADDENNSIRTINTNLDFSEFIDIEKCTEEMTLEENIYIKGFETKILNGRKMHIKAFLDANIKVYLNNEIETVVDVMDNEDDIQMINLDKNVMSLLGENSSKTVLKDTIELKSEEDFAEIMNVEFFISDIETKTSYNKILVKSNANVRIMYLTENNKVSEVVTKIPLMGFVDMPDVNDTLECKVKARLKNLIIKNNNKEEHSLDIEADIELYCKVYEIKKIKIIEDLYSISKDITLNKTRLSVDTNQTNLKENFVLKEKFTNPELLYGRVLGANLRPVLEKTEIKNGKIKYIGKIEGEIINDNENLNVINIGIPFEFEISDNDIRENSNFETEINIVSKNITSIDDGLMLEIGLQVNSTIQNSEDIDFVHEISIIDSEEQDIYSMVIYFVKPGDTLWEIAKKFRSRMEDISKANQIEDVNKIYPGQQLYIPKFTKSRIEM